MAERLYGRSHVDGGGIVGTAQTEGGHVIPEPRISEYGVHSLVAMILYPAHEIGGDTHLNTVELRVFQQLVQSVGDQMLTAAGGGAAAGDFVGDAAHGQRVQQFP